MKRNHFLDIVKGLCALFITATHFYFSDEARLHYLFPFWIDMAVPVFMLISGYVSTLSYRKNNVQTIEEAYAWKTIVSKAIRFSVPFLMAWLVEFGYMLVKNDFHMLPIPMLVIHLLQGGEGAGAYYYPLLMQFILVFPLIYFLIERLGFFGLVLTFFGTYLMEVLKVVYQMGENTYCLLLFRYTFIIAVGVYLGSSKYKERRWVSVVAFLAGIAFIVGTQYMGYSVPYIGMWVRTSLFGCLFIAPLVGYGIRKMADVKFPPLETLGKASYNIFLVQKIYYANAGKFYDLIPGEHYDLLGTMIICVVVGLIFYLVETPITKWINKHVMAAMDRHSIPASWY